MEHYIFVGGRRLAKSTSTTTSSSVVFYHADHLGSARMMTDSSGTVVRAVTYMPFGAEASSSGSDHYNFAGMEEDSETGFNHTLYRQQSPVMGRWMSPDPYNGSMDLTNPQSLNRYAYVGDDPSDLTDPTGLFAQDTAQHCYYRITERYYYGQLISVTSTFDHCEGGGGGGGANPNANVTNKPKPANNAERLKCAIDASKKGSIAGVLGLDDNPYVSAFLGNQVADGFDTATKVFDYFSLDDRERATKGLTDSIAEYAVGEQVKSVKTAALATYTYKNKAVTKALLGGPANGWSGATNLLKVGAKIFGYAKLAGDGIVFLAAYGYSCAAYGE